MKPAAAREKVRCRLITGDDLAALTDLLCEGFSGRSRNVWEAGFAHMAARQTAEGAPRYGYCLDAGGRLVGAILLIVSTRIIDGIPSAFTNVASWYVSKNYRAYAQLLVSIALRNKETTYTNVSPAPHTWAIVENQGYTRYCGGLFFAFGMLTPPAAGARIVDFDCQRHAHVPEFDLLQRHREMGCTTVVAEESHATMGFIFRRYNIRGGRFPMPAMLTIHAPQAGELKRLAGNLSRHFLRHAAPVIVFDADRPVDGLKGLYTEARGRKYFKGPHKPNHCQLADSEYAIFGV